MKQLLSSIVILLVLVGVVFAAPQAVLSAVNGKVEIKSFNGTWKPAAVGSKIDLLTTVSTGFDSTATIAIDKSKIVVRPLTRLTLDKLIEQSGSVSTSLFLRVGSVQANVKAAVPGQTQDFKVQSPYSTASVRGTIFDYDGRVLRVIEGKVQLVPGSPNRLSVIKAAIKAAQAAAAEAAAATETTTTEASGTGTETATGEQPGAGPVVEVFGIDLSMSDTALDTAFEGYVAGDAEGAEPTDAADESVSTSVSGGEAAIIPASYDMSSGTPVAVVVVNPGQGTYTPASTPTAPPTPPPAPTKQKPSGAIINWFIKK